MSRREAMRAAPLSLRIGYAAFALGLVVSLSGVVVGPEVWLVIWLPVGAVVLGVILLLDVGGAARSSADWMRQQPRNDRNGRPAIYASIGYARFFGGFLCVVASAMAFAILTGRA